MEAWESGLVATELVKRAEQIIPKLISLRSVITMSRRAAIVEEFDDDTDLSLPSRSLPGTGSRGRFSRRL
jgi:hypothetical protein